ncbi:MAG TPA: hypothetical protein ENJ95_03950 [Bacteroidetes bacterium]|nr:hypothetical protein [Bacteroidota bacterium]
MAFTTLAELQPIDSPVAGNGKLAKWTAENDASCPSPHYPEDIILLTNEKDYDPAQGIKKYKAKFWDFEKPVWVGHKADGSVLETMIILRCPPFHPPNGGGPSVFLKQIDKPPPGNIVDADDAYCK